MECEYKFDRESGEVTVDGQPVLTGVLLSCIYDDLRKTLYEEMTSFLRVSGEMKERPGSDPTFFERSYVGGIRVQLLCELYNKYFPGESEVEDLQKRAEDGNRSRTELIRSKLFPGT
jgi:hypothetical protein